MILLIRYFLKSGKNLNFRLLQNIGGALSVMSRVDTEGEIMKNCIIIIFYSPY